MNLELKFAQRTSVAIERDGKLCCWFSTLGKIDEMRSACEDGIIYGYHTKEIVGSKDDFEGED